jgi:hypothetical protein
MLCESLADSLIYPAVSPGPGAGVDFLQDAFFSDADKQPFTLDERRLLAEVLQVAKGTIRETFDTTPSQQTAIDQKLDYLASKIAELDKFNWKRLFISVLVGVSVDLSFGTLIPIPLLTALHEVVTQVVARGLPTIGQAQAPRGLTIG